MVHDVAINVWGIINTGCSNDLVGIYITSYTLTALWIVNYIKFYRVVDHESWPVADLQGLGGCSSLSLPSQGIQN